MSSGLALGISADCRRKVPYDLLGTRVDINVRVLLLTNRIVFDYW